MTPPSSFLNENSTSPHTFWNTQPVSSTPTRNPSQVSSKKNIAGRPPAQLPKNHYWANVDVFDKKELYELTLFLTLNYIQSSDENFSLYYTPDFIQWALSPPGHNKKWCVSIRLSTGEMGDEIVGFISCVPSYLTHKEDGEVPRGVVPLVNFLCVHKSYRDKRLTPLLIQELIRQVEENVVMRERGDLLNLFIQ